MTRIVSIEHIAFLVFFIVIVIAWKNPAIQKEINVTHFVNDILETDIVSLDYRCNDRPRAVACVFTTFVGFVRFASLRKVVTAKKSFSEAFCI